MKRRKEKGGYKMVKKREILDTWNQAKMSNLSFRDLLNFGISLYISNDLRALNPILILNN